MKDRFAIESIGDNYMEFNESDWFKYIIELDETTQMCIKKAIIAALDKEGILTKEYVEDTMNSRVCDLEDTINIRCV